MENSSARIQDTLFEIDQGEEVVDDDFSSFGLDDLVDVGSRRQYLIPGDLVEVMYVYAPCRHWDVQIKS